MWKLLQLEGEWREGGGEVCKTPPYPANQHTNNSVDIKGERSSHEYPLRQAATACPLLPSSPLQRRHQRTYPGPSPPNRVTSHHHSRHSPYAVPCEQGIEIYMTRTPRPRGEQRSTLCFTGFTGRFRDFYETRRHVNSWYDHSSSLVASWVSYVRWACWGK